MSSKLRYRRRKPHEREQFTVPLNQRKGPTPPPEILPWYWSPGREIATHRAPEAFLKRLHEIDPDLYVVFSPVHERWILWVKNPRVGRQGMQAEWYERGWQLLMLWEHPVTKEFLPLNELMFHNIYMINMEKYGNARQYFDKIQENVARERAARDAKYNGDRESQQNEFRQSLQISSAGRGNRFALHHDNVGAPSRGELNWREETKRLRLPSDMLKNVENEKEKQFYGR
jgi:hypothetical protein